MERMTAKEPKMRVIWIDDMRNPSKRLVLPKSFALELNRIGLTPEIIWLKTYDEWINWIINTWHQEDDDEYINCFCLDHDLGCFDSEGKEKTGLDVAKDIINELIISDRKLPFYECHSSNPFGRENILSVFETYKKHFLKLEDR